MSDNPGWPMLADYPRHGGRRGGNKIPASYLARFMPSYGLKPEEKDLPAQVQNFLEGFG